MKAGAIVGVVIGTVVGAYIITSITIIHIAARCKCARDLLKKKFPYPVSNIAHRGGSLLGPENTMFTFERGVNEGKSDMLELDVRQSRDGQIVVSHDKYLERSCGAQYTQVAVSDITVGSDPSATLPQSQRTIPLEFATSAVKQYEATAGIPVDDTTRVCLLREVLEKLPNTPLHIDIKDVDKQFVHNVLDLIAEYKRESTTFVGSSQPKNETLIREYFSGKDPSVRKRYRLFPSVKGFVVTHLLFYTGLIAYVSIWYDVFSIPVFTSTMRATAISAFGPVVGHAGSFLFTAPTLWRFLQNRGVCVVGWVLNDEVDMEEGVQLPLNGLMTDDPIKLHSFYEAHTAESKLNLLGT